MVTIFKFSLLSLTGNKLQPENISFYFLKVTDQVWESHKTISININLPPVWRPHKTLQNTNPAFFSLRDNKWNIQKTADDRVIIFSWYNLCSCKKQFVSVFLVLFREKGGYSSYQYLLLQPAMSVSFTKMLGKNAFSKI